MPGAIARMRDAEYLAFEAASDIKHESLNGEVNVTQPIPDHERRSVQAGWI